MCTAVSYCPKDHYFGRNLDLDHSYNETVTITPRKFSFHFRNGEQLNTHHAMIGMATVANEYPLYYEATNEKGLSIAGLNFPDNAKYYSSQKDKLNITPFELTPYLLGKCINISEAKALLNNINLWNCPFSNDLPLSPLHWLISDRANSITVECTEKGMTIYDNPMGVLTNNPPFPYHLHNFTNYMPLTHQPPYNNQPIPLVPYSLGMGSFGLPGDMSSGSRFVKAAFTKLHSIRDCDEEAAVNQFFHILNSVCQQKGVTTLSNGAYEYTLYSSCCNTDRGIYYYTTYNNSRITAIDMHKEDLSGNKLITYPLMSKPQILYQN